MSGTANASRRVEWRPTDASRRAYAGYCRGRRIAPLSRQGAESPGALWEISIGTDSDWPDAGALPWADAVAWVEARVTWLTAPPGA
jgi:hypothetical protein